MLTKCPHSMHLLSFLKQFPHYTVAETDRPSYYFSPIQGKTPVEHGTFPCFSDYHRAIDGDIHQGELTDDSLAPDRSEELAQVGTTFTHQQKETVRCPGGTPSQHFSLSYFLFPLSNFSPILRTAWVIPPDVCKSQGWDHRSASKIDPCNSRETTTRVH